MSALASRVPVAASDPMWRALAGVADPEIPVLSVLDLGIVRALERDADAPSRVVVRVTPTYVACPATDAIVGSIRDALIAAGADDVRVDIALAPAWTTDWITDEGRRKLAEYGIAPPPGVAAAGVARVDVAGIGRSRPGRAEVACPRCGSRRTRVLSAFGSTACKALLRCDDCLEPFDWFKPH